MRNWTFVQGRALRAVSALGMCAAASAVTGHASAAPKTAEPPLPNVMLLVDTSGSMEQMIDSTSPESGADACTVTGGATGAATNPNRWGTLLQVLTGQFAQGYRCYKDDRSSGSFKDEYTINGSPPYDYGYSTPYHRPVFYDGTDACMIGPWKLSNGPSGTGAGVGAGSFGSQSQTTNQADEFANDALAMFKVASIATPASKASGGNCGFTIGNAPQYQNGVLDSARDLVRFGMMTYDTDTDPGISVSTSGGNLQYLSSPTNPFLGTFSYYPQWDGTTWAAGTAGDWSCPQTNGTNQWCQGSPPNCGNPLPFEVGARNRAAPMWEGRMVQFPNGASSLTDVETSNDAIQNILLASRPFGATPIQAQLWDARNYFFFDPNGPVQSDPYTYDGSNAANSCRPQYIILLTDGQPNLDLETICQKTGTPNGVCPYTIKSAANNNQRSWDIAADLAKGGPASKYPPVKTFVIGFAQAAKVIPGALGSMLCSDFVTPGTPPTWNASVENGLCSTPGTPPAAGSITEACCNLHQIAIAGTPSGQPGRGAYFADTGADLASAFAAILGSIAGKTSSKAIPTVTPVLGPLNSGTAVSAQFLASFDTTNPSTGTTWPWSGNLNRLRTKCTGGVATPVGIVQNNDNFRKMVDNMAPTNRNVLTAIDTNATIDQTMSYRPFIAADDGAGAARGKEVGHDAAGIVTSVLGGHLGVLSAGCGTFSQPTTSGLKTFSALNQADCTKAILAFTLGTDFSGDNAVTYPFLNVLERGKNAVSTSKFSAMGAILHSNPAIVPAPSAQARDDSYRAFAAINYNRPQMLYVATIDGLLHAFDATSEPGTAHTDGDTAPTDATGIFPPGKGGNEMWAFIPPAVLPTLRANYPGGGSNLLDGTPVVKDIVFTRTATTTTAAANWHTVLVGSLGASGRGYYALDVTDPKVTSSWAAATTTLPTTPTAAGATATTAPTGSKGPHFLWQMANIPLAAGDVQLFGKHAATPALTTLAISNGTAVEEVGVAILPGGVDDGPFGVCARTSNTDTAGKHVNTGLIDATPEDDKWGVRNTVRRWSSAGCSRGVPGRSVSIVRVSDGKLLAVFGRYSATANQSDIAQIIKTNGTAQVINTQLDSPMTGTPVVYPAQVGAVATKFFIGDADGTVWRFDVSSTDPANWKAQMFFDTFNQNALNAIGFPSPTDPKFASVGQPIQITPVLSTDRVGNLVLLVATGDQDTFASVTYKAGKDGDKDDELPAYNFIYSLTEKPATGDPAPNLRATVNWYQTFQNGERVTGPMAIFDSTAYFSTYQPPSGTGNACSLGDGRIWGVDYVNPSSACAQNETQPTGAPYASVGCAGAPATSSLDASASTTGSTLPGFYFHPGGTLVGQDSGLTGHVITGVSIAATPPCATLTSATDPLVGGTYVGLSSLVPATYSLIASVATNATGTAATNQSGASFAQKLSSPKLKTRIDSWAAIVE